MRELEQGKGRPEIVVGALDQERLSDLALAAEARLPDVAEELLTELGRARIVADDAVPPDVVRMGSTVTYDVQGEERRVVLVYPAEADIAQARISIMTPIGAALIGLRAGQSITWTTRDGRRQQLTVRSVT